MMNGSRSFDFGASESCSKGARGDLRRAADGLALAASPVFAIMALMTVTFPGPTNICITVPAALPLDGMVVMYLLMSIFHLAPWLRLISYHRGRTDLARPGHDRPQAAPMN